LKSGIIRKGRPISAAVDTEAEKVAGFIRAVSNGIPALAHYGGL